MLLREAGRHAEQLRPGRDQQSVEDVLDRKRPEELEDNFPYKREKGHPEQALLRVDEVSELQVQLLQLLEPSARHVDQARHSVPILERMVSTLLVQVAFSATHSRPASAIFLAASGCVSICATPRARP